MVGLSGDLLGKGSVYYKRSLGSASEELRFQACPGPHPSLCPHLSPPYLSSFAFSCHQHPPSISHQTVASARGEERQMWGAPQREGGVPTAYQSRDPCPDVTLPETVLQWLQTGWTRFTGFHFGCTQILVYLSACTLLCENEK